MYRTASGIAVTARVGSDIAPTMTGGDAELDELLRKTAEAIYRTAQPYRYAQYVFTPVRRFEEGLAAQKDLIANGSPWTGSGPITAWSRCTPRSSTSRKSQGHRGLPSPCVPIPRRAISTWAGPNGWPSMTRRR